LPAALIRYIVGSSIEFSRSDTESARIGTLMQSLG